VLLAAGAIRFAPLSAQATAPEAQIANREIRATLRLPDPEKGYYRATRFDWSGSIASLDWHGHSYFGQWFTKYDPKINDAITGPVEEFDSVGYDDAKVGEPFLRIGVGAIRKLAEPRYRQFFTYDIADSGKWTIKKVADAIEFTHEMADTNGYAYVYRKKVLLTGHTLVLEHHLKNTGKKPIATTAYDHDFFMLDNQPTGPDVTVKFVFEPKNVSPLKELAEIRGKEWHYLREFQPRQSYETELTGFGPTAKDYDFRVENRRTGAAVHQTGDRPLTSVNLWAPRTAVCPEGFIEIRAEPGREFSWRIAYEFYEVPKRRQP
jgi:hypothetical protein